MSLKHVISWFAVIIGAAGVILSYYAVWVVAAYFASGVVWYANLAGLVSGPIAGFGAAVAWRPPRQNLVVALGTSALALWLLLWVLMFTVLGFGFHPEANP
jgi:hypothetical protein